METPVTDPSSPLQGDPMLNQPPSQSTRPSRWISPPAAIPALCILLLALLPGCSKPAVVEPEKALPNAAGLTGWTPLGDAQTYDRKTLFNYIDGASEYFFTYSFEKMAMQQYRNTAGLEVVVEVWRLSKSADAYGLFSGHAGAAVSIGHANDATLETGSRLYFWQNRFYAVLTATTTLSDDDLKTVAQSLSAGLPAGGARPALVGRLPSDQLTAGTIKYFHEELAIQDQLWLGGENLLGLGQDTDAVFALYSIDGEQVKLLLVQYPDAKRAAAGLQGLGGGSLEGFLASDTKGSLLGAVFGKTTAAQAGALLAKALGK
jgi:hypothetical protein